MRPLSLILQKTRNHPHLSLQTQLPSKNRRRARRRHGIAATVSPPSTILVSHSLFSLSNSNSQKPSFLLRQTPSSFPIFRRRTSSPRSLPSTLDVVVIASSELIDISQILKQRTTLQIKTPKSEISLTPSRFLYVGLSSGEGSSSPPLLGRSGQQRLLAATVAPPPCAISPPGFVRSAACRRLLRRVMSSDAPPRYGEQHHRRPAPSLLLPNDNSKRDDPDIDAMLKDRVRWGDSMAHLAKKTQLDALLLNLGDSERMKESGFIIPQEIPVHCWIRRGIDAAPNRYGIKPGRHWDGVDRSTGYEKELFKRTNDKRATEAEAYLSSVADM